MADPRTTDGIRKLGFDDGQIAGVVAEPVILLVGGVVFFINDDQFQIRQRGKQRGACADDQVDPAAPDLPPLVVTDALGDAAVNDGDFIGVKPSGDPGDQLRGEGDFRNQIDGRAAGFQNMIDGVKDTLPFFRCR